MKKVGEVRGMSSCVENLIMRQVGKDEAHIVSDGVVVSFAVTGIEVWFL